LVGVASINFAVAQIYSSDLEENYFQKQKTAWRQSFKSARKKMSTAIENTKRDLEQAQEAELFQLRGKALYARLYELGPQNLPKEKSIKLDYEDADGTRVVEVPLDKSRNFADNAELCFKKAKKFTRAVGELAEMLKVLDVRLAAVDFAGKSLEQCQEEAGFDGCAELFRTAGIPIPDLTTKEKADDTAKLCLEFLSSDGFKIVCGRSQEENRQVTFKECRGNDMWMHVKGVPGAHVAIISQKNKTIPLNTLLEAAQATLYHTKIRDGRKAEVDYTFRKYVKPIKGTIAEVTYTENKTLNVEASADEYRKLVSRK
jgi:predicted ribosome quality control (RQC) complex YloA/Tae2 family protein